MSWEALNAWVYILGEISPVSIVEKSDGVPDMLPVELEDPVPTVVVESVEEGLMFSVACASWVVGVIKELLKFISPNVPSIVLPPW